MESDSDKIVNSEDEYDDDSCQNEHWADQIYFLMENPLKKHPNSEKYRLQSLYRASQRIIDQIQMIKKGQQSVLQIESEKISKIKNSLKFEKLKLKKRMHTQKFKTFRDKCGFTAGVFNLLISIYLMGVNLEWLYYWYSITCFFTILIRFYRYIKINEQYFFLDFCYFANFTIILFFNFFRDSEVLFSIVFVQTMGPLLLAIPSFRNSLVFHSLDRLTSLKIHLEPAIALYAYRWNDHTVEDVFAKQPFTFYYFVCTFGRAFLLYLLWAIIHYVAVFWILKQKDQNKKYITTFDYMTKNPKSWKCKLTYKFGKNLKVAGLIYIFLNICFTFLAIAFAVIQFRFFYLNSLYLIFCLYISVWVDFDNLFSVYCFYFRMELIFILNILAGSMNSPSKILRACMKSQMVKNFKNYFVNKLIKFKLFFEEQQSETSPQKQQIVKENEINPQKKDKEL